MTDITPEEMAEREKDLEAVADRNRDNADPRIGLRFMDRCYRLGVVIDQRDAAEARCRELEEGALSSQQTFVAFCTDSERQKRRIKELERHVTWVAWPSSEGRHCFRSPEGRYGVCEATSGDSEELEVSFPGKGPSESYQSGFRFCPIPPAPEDKPR